MRTGLLLALLALASAASAQAPKAKPLYKVVRLTTSQVGISCTNGADPTGRKMGDLLVISCGE